MASKELDALIAQHLRKHGRKKTLAAFIKECNPVLEGEPSDDLDALMTRYHTENAGKENEGGADGENDPTDKAVKEQPNKKGRDVKPELVPAKGEEVNKRKTRSSSKKEEQEQEAAKPEPVDAGQKKKGEKVQKTDQGKQPAVEDAEPKRKGRKSKKTVEQAVETEVVVPDTEPMKTRALTDVLDAETLKEDRETKQGAGVDAKEKEAAEPNKKGKKAKKAGKGDQEAAGAKVKGASEKGVEEVAGSEDQPVADKIEDAEPKRRGRKAKKTGEQAPHVTEAEDTEPKKTKTVAEVLDSETQEDKETEQVAGKEQETTKPKEKGKRGKKAGKVEQEAKAEEVVASNAEEQEVTVNANASKGKRAKKGGEGEQEGAEKTTNKRKTRSSNKPAEEPVEPPLKKAKKTRGSKVEQAEAEKTIAKENGEAAVDDKPGDAKAPEEAKPEQMEVDKDTSEDTLKKKKKGRKSANASIAQVTEEENPKEEKPEQPEPAATESSKKQKKAKKNSKELPESVKEEGIQKVDDQLAKEDDKATETESEAVDDVAEEGKKPKRKRTDDENDKSSVRPFQRVKPDEVEFLDERLKDNSYWAKDGAENGWGAKAQEVLGQVKGRGFRHEKTKKKRGSYRGGTIDTQPHSIKFDYDE